MLGRRTGAQSRRTGRELAILRKAWDAGSRNAMLADQYSKRLLSTPPGDGSRSHLDDALDVCDQALATKASATGRVWDRLQERRERILSRQAAPPRKAPATTRNRRKRRETRYSVTFP